MSIPKADLIALRPGCDEDKTFIMATWLRGAYHGSTGYSQVPKHVFMVNYHRILTALLKRPEVVVTVACLVEDPSVVLGYSVYRSAANINVLDWIYVKPAWRKIGIAKSLAPDPVHACTHLTKVGKALKPKTCVYNPFML
jgi:hypothetical protein